MDYLSAPALQNFYGGQIYAASRVKTDFTFDAGGNRARQIKQRIAADDSRQLEDTLYLGSYEREIHETKATSSASPVVTKTIHRHSIGGFAVYTCSDTVGTSGSVVRLSTILKDHLGSTDVILTGTWNGSTFATPSTERRAPETQVTCRATDSDAFHTSAQDYDSGYTGHEQLDHDSGTFCHGRISGLGGATSFEFKDDLAQCFPGKLHLEDVFNLSDQRGAVIGAPFGEQFIPPPNHVLVDGRGAFLIDPTA